MMLPALKEKQARIRRDDKKKAAVPSPDFPKKDIRPHLDPTAAERGSAMASTRIEADETALSKRIIVVRQETR